MPIRVYYEVLNQKGTPALYSDNYASRPAAGYAGRIFNSPDTGQIFYDTGTTWTLLADAGVGSGSLASVCANGNTTATGIIITAGGLSTNSLTSTNLTAGSIPFISTAGLFSQDNTNFFWDNTFKRFGLGTNTPTAPFDIHTTANVGIQINNTTTADSKIAFLQADAGKWRIGNLYSGGANLFHIYNNTAISLAMQIDSTNAALFYGSLSANSFVSAGAGVLLTNGSVTTSAGKTGIGGLTAGLSIALASGFNQTLSFPTGVAYTYTYPSATGTLALTSDLSSYLPLTGGTLSGALTINSTLYINPTNTSLTGLDVASNNISFRSDNLEGSKRQLSMTMGSGTLIQFTGQGFGAARATDIAFYTSAAGGVNSTPALYMTGGNNVGIGTGTLSARFTVVSLTGETIRLISVDTIGDNYMSFYNSSGTRQGYIGYGASATDSMQIVNESNAPLSFFTNGTSRMTITDNGYIYINTTSSIYSTIGRMEFLFTGSSTYGINMKTTSGDGLPLNFINSSGTQVGYIYMTSSATQYSTTSDYRLKQDFKNFDGLSLLNNIKIYDYEWKSDNNRTHGVIAHELAEILPYAVSGEKDGDRLQGVDYSKIVPIMVKGIQQIDTRLTNVEDALLTLQQNLN